jgi:hypothetical protein
MKQMLDKRLLGFLVVIAIYGCAAQKVLVPTGGSRSDGTVDLSYEYGGFEVPQLNPEQGHQAAVQRCTAWGYSDAEPFGGSISRCTFANQYGCMRQVVTIRYQCTGNPSH